MTVRLSRLWQNSQRPPYKSAKPKGMLEQVDDCPAVMAARVIHVTTRMTVMTAALVFDTLQKFRLSLRRRMSHVPFAKLQHICRNDGNRVCCHVRLRMDAMVPEPGKHAQLT